MERKSECRKNAFEIAFRITVRDWKGRKLSGDQAMEIMAALMEEWDLLKRLGESQFSDERKETISPIT